MLPIPRGPLQWERNAASAVLRLIYLPWSSQRPSPRYRVLGSARTGAVLPPALLMIFLEASSGRAPRATSETLGLIQQGCGGKQGFER